MVPVSLVSCRREPFPWDYAAQAKEHVKKCNACGSTLWVTLCNRDRYGFPVTAHCCHSCGLIFLSPRMTAEAYARFYRETYRDLVEWYTPGSAPAGEESQTRYAKKIIPILEPFVSKQADSLLDIGGAPGVCAQVVAEGLRLDAGEGEVVVLDPACRVTAHAEPVSYVSGSIEDDVFTEGAQFDVILCCQTVDHLLDLRGSLEKMRGLLTDDGVLWVDILDWLYMLRRRQSVEAIIKVDHPYGLTPRRFLHLLMEVGFAPQRFAHQETHVGFVCKKSVPSSVMDSASPILGEIRKIEAESKWTLARGR